MTDRGVKIPGLTAGGGILLEVAVKLQPINNIHQDLR